MGRAGGGVWMYGFREYLKQHLYPGAIHMLGPGRRAYSAPGQGSMCKVMYRPCCSSVSVKEASCCVEPLACARAMPFSAMLHAYSMLLWPLLGWERGALHAPVQPDACAAQTEREVQPRGCACHSPALVNNAAQPDLAFTLSATAPDLHLHYQRLHQICCCVAPPACWLQSHTGPDPAPHHTTPPPPPHHSPCSHVPRPGQGHCEGGSAAVAQ